MDVDEEHWSNSAPRKKLFSQVEELGWERLSQVMSNNSLDREIVGSDFIIFRFAENVSPSVFSVLKSLFVPTYFNTCQRNLYGKCLGFLEKQNFRN